MRFSVISVVLAVSAAQQQAPQLTLAQQLHGPYGTRILALKRLLDSNTLLADPRTRRAVVKLLDDERHNPNIEAFAESLQWQDYDGKLGEVVQKIATEYHDRAVWTALAQSAYNDEGDFGKWLASQPEAVDSLWELRESKNRYVRSNVLVVLGMALGRCETHKPDSSCGPILQKKPDVLALLRRKAFDDPEASLAAVRGLGYCGEKQDIALLGKTQPPQRDQLSLEYWPGFVHQSQRQIESRLQK